jgi:hypothetical protein
MCGGPLPLLLLLFPTFSHLLNANRTHHLLLLFLLLLLLLLFLLFLLLFLLLLSLLPFWNAACVPGA